MLTAQPVLSKTLLWTPTWTNFTLGASTRQGQYVRLGRWIEFQSILTFAAGFAFTGQPSCDLPVPAAFAPSAAAFQVICMQVGTGFYEGGVVTPTTTSTGGIVTWLASGVYATEVAITSSIPFSWAAGHHLDVTGHYLAADA